MRNTWVRSVRTAWGRAMLSVSVAMRKSPHVAKSKSSLVAS